MVGLVRIVTACLGLFCRSLNLGGNALTGSVPSGVTALTNLQSLTLSSNKLVGTLPTSFTAVSKLSWLDVSSNALAGTVLNYVTAFTNLVHLDVSVNSLSEAFPGSLPNFLTYVSNVPPAYVGRRVVGNGGACTMIESTVALTALVRDRSFRV